MSENLRARRGRAIPRSETGGLFVGILVVALLACAGARVAAQPVVSLANVPSSVLVGEEFTFNVEFACSSTGYGPFIDLVVQGGGEDRNDSSGPCDGLEVVSAKIASVGASPLPPAADLCSGAQVTATGQGNVASGPVDLTVDHSPLTCTNCGSWPSQVQHPYPEVTQPVTLSCGEHLYSTKLLFGAFSVSQSPIVIEVTAKVHGFADFGPGATVPLTMKARGGFLYGTGSPPANWITSIGGWSGTATVTPVAFTVKKKFGGPECETVACPNCIVPYEITVDVATGLTIGSLSVQDMLPPELVYDPGTANLEVWVDPYVIWQGGAPTGPFQLTVNEPPSGPEVFLADKITGQPNVDHELHVIFGCYVPDGVLGPNCQNSPTPLKNQIHVEGDASSLDPRDTPVHATDDGSSGGVDQPEAKCLAIQKRADNPFCSCPLVAVKPGDTVRYTLNFQISDCHTMGQLLVTDRMSDGQRLLLTPAPTLTVHDRFGAYSTTFVPGVSMSQDVELDPFYVCNRRQGTANIRFDLRAAMAAAPYPRHAAGILTGGNATPGSSATDMATGEIVFYVEITDEWLYPTKFHQGGDPYVSKDDTITDCVTIDGAVYNNEPVGTTPQSVIGSASDGSDTKLWIASDIPYKSVYAVKRNGGFIYGPNGSSPVPDLRPGDEVTFRILYAIPSGDAENLTITDWVPSPVLSVADPDGDPSTAPALSWAPFSTCPAGSFNWVPNPGEIACGPDHSPYSSGSTNFPAPPTLTAVNANDNSFTLDYGTMHDTFNLPKQIDILYTLTVTNIPYPDGLTFLNETMVCETDSSKNGFCQVALASIVVREPALCIKKGAIATSNPNGFPCSDCSSPWPLTAGNPVALPAGVPIVCGNSAPPFAPPINHGNLSGFVGRDMCGVDADDLITFVIVVENTGGAPAYEIELADMLPANLTYVTGTLCVRIGGSPVPFTPNWNFLPPLIVVHIDDVLYPCCPASGENIAVITFQARLDPPSALESSRCENKAYLVHYTSAEDDTHEHPNFVDQNFGGNCPSPFVSAASACVGPRVESKCIPMTSEAHTAPASADSGGTVSATIGEIVRFRLVAVLPEGTTKGFQLTDYLPVGLTYIGNPKVVFISNIPMTSPAGSLPSASGSIVPGSSCLAFPVPAVAPSGGTQSLPFGTGADPSFFLQPFDVTNHDNNDPDLEGVILEFNAQVDNIAGNAGSPATLLTNGFVVEYLDTCSGGTVTSGPTPAYVRVVEPKLTLEKTASPTTASPGDIVTYTVTIDSVGTSTPFDITLEDTLPYGMVLVNAAFAVPPGWTNNSSLQHSVKVTCPGAAPTWPVTITYQATVSTSAQCGSTWENTAILMWSSLPGMNGTPPGPGNQTGQQTAGSPGSIDGERLYSTTDSATVTVECVCPPGSVALDTTYGPSISLGDIPSGSVKIVECFARTTDATGQVWDTYTYDVTNLNIPGCGLCTFSVRNYGFTATPACNLTGWIGTAQSNKWVWTKTGCGLQIGQSGQFQITVPGPTHDTVLFAGLGSCTSSLAEMETTGPAMQPPPCPDGAIRHDVTTGPLPGDGSGFLDDSIEIDECVTRTTDSTGQTLDTYTYTVTNLNPPGGPCICLFSVERNGHTAISQTGSPGTWTGTQAANWWTWSCSSACGIPAGQFAIFTAVVVGPTTDINVDAFADGCGPAPHAVAELHTTGPKAGQSCTSPLYDYNKGPQVASAGIPANSILVEECVTSTTDSYGVTDTYTYTVTNIGVDNAGCGLCKFSIPIKPGIVPKAQGTVQGWTSTVTATDWVWEYQGFGCGLPMGSAAQFWVSVQGPTVDGTTTSSIWSCGSTGPVSVDTTGPDIAKAVTCPDLTIDIKSIRCGCREIVGGWQCEYEVVTEIRNIGTATALAPFGVGLSSSLGAQPDKVITQSLAPGKTTLATFTFAVTCPPDGCGSSSFIAKVDNTGYVEECDETNNSDHDSYRCRPRTG